MTKNIRVKNKDLIDMEFNKQWRDNVQADIYKFIELQNLYEASNQKHLELIEKKKRCEEKNETETKYFEELLQKINIYRKKTKEIHQEYRPKEINIYRAFKKYLELPFALNNEYGLDILNDDVPIVFSYEQVKENIYCLWDTNHNISQTSLMYGINLDRIALFIEGIDKVKPDILALELTGDRGQKIIDDYLNGDISREEAQALLFGDHWSASTDDYTVLLDYAKDENIIVKAVDIKSEEYENLNDIPDVTKDKDLTESEANIEISKYRISLLKPRLEDLSEQGKTLLIIGAGLRPYLIDVMKT